MPLDPNIILGLKPVEVANPLEAQAKAYNLRSMGQKVQLQDQEIQANQGVKDAYGSNLVTNPDGSRSVNMKGVIQSLYSTNPMKAQELQTTSAQSELGQKQAQMKMLTDQIQTAHELASSMSDPQSYQAARQKGIELGLPNADKLPEQYDPNYVKELFNRTMSTKEKFEQANNDRTYQTKVDENKIKHEENSIKRDQISGDRVDKMTKAMKDDLDADKGRAGNFGQISAKVQSADRLKTLVSAFKDGNLPGAQTEELALGLSSMLAPGGGQSRAQVEALVPKSAIGDANKFKSWLFNEPNGAGQQAFVKMMSDTIERERDTANTQLNNIRASRLAAHDRLRKQAPDQYSAVLQSYGMDPKNVKNGRYIQPAASDQAPVLKTHEIEWAE